VRRSHRKQQQQQQIVASRASSKPPPTAMTITRHVYPARRMPQLVQHMGGVAATCVCGFQRQADVIVQAQVLCERC